MSTPKHEVRRAYDAWVDYQSNGFQVKTPAQIKALPDSNGNVVCPVRIDPRLIHRKVWVFMFANATTAHFLDADLVFYLKGLEVLRQKFIQWESSGVQGLNWTLAQTWTGTQQGTYAGMLYVVLAGNVFLPAWFVSPQILNIQADSAAIVINTITGATCVFDALLQIASFQGI